MSLPGQSYLLVATPLPGAADADAEIEEGPDFGGLLKAKTENCCPDSSVARSSRLVSEFPKRVPKFFRPESIAENWVPTCSHFVALQKRRHTFVGFRGSYGSLGRLKPRVPPI